MGSHQCGLGEQVVVSDYRGARGVASGVCYEICPLLQAQAGSGLEFGYLKL